MWYNENGWKDIEKGRYDRAEQKFNMAIKEIQPYSPANRKLMARSYCDLARVLYYQERYADAEPLAKWALSVRDADKKASPDSVFQCLFTLASIHARPGALGRCRAAFETRAGDPRERTHRQSR